MDWLLLKTNAKILSKRVKMLIHQWSVEVSCPWRGICAPKSGRGCCPCKVANKNCNANCQCRWRSCNEVTKLKVIKRSAVRYFSIFLFEIQRAFIRKCVTFIYNPQALPGSLKISNLMFLANPVYRVRSHPSAWHLKTFQWHGWTRSSNNSIFLFEIYQFFVGKYSTFIYKPQALLESEKNANVICFADLVHSPAVLYFSIFLFEKYQFLLEIFYLHLESSSASRKWTNLNVVLFADSVHWVRRDPSVTLKKNFLRILPDKT